MSDDAGPTPQRLKRSEGFFTQTGQSRRSQHFTMLDDPLGRAWMRQVISGLEYSALRRYALHWLAGGLAGHVGSIDLNRILSFDPASMSGLAKTEAQANHRQLYHAARDNIGTRPALVADLVACHEANMTHVGRVLGYKSEARGRSRAMEILADAGYRLDQFWTELSRGH